MAVRISDGGAKASAQTTWMKSTSSTVQWRERERERAGSVGKIGVDAMQRSAGEASRYESGVDDSMATYKSVISGMVKANKSNVITEENYYLLHWLYRIRRVGCARGLRIGFLQPDFLCIIYGHMMRSRRLWRTDGDIREAANLWCSNRAEAEAQYGHISDWDVSSVTDMSRLFQGGNPYKASDSKVDRFRGKGSFNDDISRWDVSNVTDMRDMFHYACAFNQAIGDWDVSKVTNMQSMFHEAHAFNQPVGNWNVSEVTDMSWMFRAARVFNQAVGNWDVSNATQMNWMFEAAAAFDQAIGGWDVSKVTNMRCMFCDARSFNQPVGDWDVSKVTDMSTMFCYSHAFNQTIGNWNVSKVTNMHWMFRHAESFNQDLTRWDMRSVIDADGMFYNAYAMQLANRPTSSVIR